MKTVRRKNPAPPARSGEIARLRLRLSEAEETLRAIRGGEVDSVVVAGLAGPQVFTLEGAGHAYRMLIESMNEGALTLTSGAVILYANQCFARMLRCPLEKVLGSSFQRLLSPPDQAALRPLLKRPSKSGSKLQAILNTADGLAVPVQISIRRLARTGPNAATVGMVLTDMSEPRRCEEMLRAMTHRVVQAQEAERGRVALELHDHITQLLCAVLVRSQSLADRLSPGNAAAKREALKLRKLLREAAEEVQRIAGNLRPGLLDHLGLGSALRALAGEFEARTSVRVSMVCPDLALRLPADTELALYRIVQVALKNVEEHAGALNVAVRLTRRPDSVELTIHDDGIGFDTEHHTARQRGKGGFGILGMRERASHVGGAFKLKSAHRAGTEIEVRIPLSPNASPIHSKTS